VLAQAVAASFVDAVLGAHVRTSSGQSNTEADHQLQLHCLELEAEMEKHKLQLELEDKKLQWEHVNGSNDSTS